MSDIDTKYAALGGVTGFLGQPQTGELVCPDGIGRYRHYAGGSIYWSPDTGAHEVHGLIRGKWASLGWERSFLGYPLTDEASTGDAVGRYNDFQGGSIFWSPTTGACEVHGMIRDRWSSLGLTRSEFGYPTSDETSTPDGSARLSRFEHGSIYWIGSPNVQANQTAYPYIRFQPGDKVWFDAGGCCQTGGTGSTWKRYLDPQGPDADRLFHGLAWVPGALPGLERIQGIENKPIGIQSIPNPTDLYLRLGYEDDDYTDNGYYARDDGWGSQCVNQPNAWAMAMVVHGGIVGPVAEPKDLDLVWTQTDDNLIPLNPQWGAQTRGQTPDPPEFDLIDSSNPGLGANMQGMTSQAVTVDSPSGWNSAWCSLGALGSLHGHVNWFPVTVTGTISWEKHSSPGADDDYNFLLSPDGGGGLCVASNGRIEIEFDSDETIDQFGSTWWNQFHDLVDNDDAQAHALVSNLPCMVTGLFGLDIEHGVHSELHPAWAFAMRVDATPRNETWAIFLRNWGDEGYCSQNQHRVYFLENRFTFKLPWLQGYTAVKALPTSEFTTNDPQQVAGPTVTPLPDKSGVLVTFKFPDPEAGALLDGTLCLEWSSQPPRPAPQAVDPAKPAQVAPAAAPGPACSPHPPTPVSPIDKHASAEQRIAATILALPDAQQAALFAQLTAPRRPYRTAPTPPASPLASTRQILGAASTAMPVVKHVIDSRKAARAQHCRDCVEQAFGGSLAAIAAAANAGVDKKYLLNVTDLERAATLSPGTGRGTPSR